MELSIPTEALLNEQDHLTDSHVELKMLPVAFGESPRTAYESWCGKEDHLKRL